MADYPFSAGQNFPGQLGAPSTPAPWLGGMLVPISAGGANANQTIAHGLGRQPRFCWCADVGRNVNMPSPVPRGTTNWNYANAFLNLPSRSYPVILLFG